MPQKFSLNNIDKYLDVFLRVRNVYKDVNINVKSGGKIIKSFKREHIAPAEMERLIIPKNIIGNLNYEGIQIMVEEV